MALTMPKTQREQLLVIAGVIAILIAAAYWYLVYSPKSAELAVASAKVDTLEASLVATKARMGRNTTAQLREQAKSYADNLQLMRTLVPAANELNSVIDQISTAARRAGLEVGKFDPLGAEQGPDFDAYRYKLTVTGGFHSITEFVANVGSLPRIVVPVGMQMAALPATSGPVDPKKAVLAVFDLHTFVAHTAPAAKPAPEKGGE